MTYPQIVNTKEAKRTNKNKIKTASSNTKKVKKTKLKTTLSTNQKNATSNNNSIVVSRRTLTKIVQANKDRAKWVDKHALNNNNNTNIGASIDNITNNKHVNKLNIYAKNLRMYRNDYDTFKFLLHRLTSNLPRDIWIKVSDEPITIKYLESIYKKIDSHINNMRKQGKPITSFLKPYGSWFSRGEWLFHDNCCNPAQHISLIRVNPKAQFYSITGDKIDSKDKGKEDGKPRFTDPGTINENYMKRFKRLQRKYQVEFNKFNCGTSIDVDFSNSTNKKNTMAKCLNKKTKKKCNNDPDCIWYKEVDLYQWLRMAEDGYHGFILDPYPSWKQLQQIDSISLDTFDVSSLVIWHQKAMSDYSNLGTVGSIMSKNKKCQQIKKDKIDNVLCVNTIIDTILKAANDLTALK